MTRPPSLYGPSQETRKNVIPIPHDKFKFSQCVYTAPRTLIQCKERRTKEQLARNRGLCELHSELQTLCAKQGELENELINVEVEKITPVPFEDTIRINGHVTDIPPFLKEKTRWQDEINSKTAINDIRRDRMERVDPLRNSEFLTEKDYLRSELAKLAAIREQLMLARRENEERAWKRMTELGVNAGHPFEFPPNEDGSPIDKNSDAYKIMQAQHVSIKNEMKLHDVLEGVRDRKTTLPPCDYEWEEDGEMKQCTNNALPSAQLCKQHILNSSTQKAFVACRVCGGATIDLGQEETYCEEHKFARTKKMVSPNGTTRVYRAPPKDHAHSVPPWHNYEGTNPAITQEVVLDGPSLLAEEENNKRTVADALGCKLPVSRRKLSDPSYRKPTVATMKMDDAFMAALMGPRPVVRQRRKSLTEQQRGLELTCARVREFTPRQFEIARQYNPRVAPSMQPRVPIRGETIAAEMEESQLRPPLPPSSSLSSQPSLVYSTPSTSMTALTQSQGPPTGISSVQSRIKPTAERPKIRQYSRGGEGGGEKELPPSTSRSSFVPPSSSSSTGYQQEALHKMYGKQATFASMMKDQERGRPMSRAYQNRTSFPIGKVQSAMQYAARLNKEDAPPTSSPSASSSATTTPSTSSTSLTTVPTSASSLSLSSPPPPPPTSTAQTWKKPLAVYPPGSTRPTVPRGPPGPGPGPQSSRGYEMVRKQQAPAKPTGPGQQTQAKPMGPGQQNQAKPGMAAPGGPARPPMGAGRGVGMGAIPPKGVPGVPGGPQGPSGPSGTTTATTSSPSGGWSGAGSGYHFKPVGQGQGRGQLPVRQAAKEGDKATGAALATLAAAAAAAPRPTVKSPASRPAAAAAAGTTLLPPPPRPPLPPSITPSAFQKRDDVSKPDAAHTPRPTIPSFSPSKDRPTGAASSTSIPTLSAKDGRSSPLSSPFSTPPKLEKEKEPGPSSSAESISSPAKERQRTTSQDQFNVQIDDIEEDEEFEEEL